MGWISMVLQGAGSTMGAVGQVEAARSEKSMHRHNARVAENNAKMERQRARFLQARQAEAGERKKGQIVALAGKSGAMSDVGAPMELAVEQAQELELENILIGFEGDIAAKRLLQVAEGERFAGKVKLVGAKRSALASMISSSGQTAGQFSGGGGGSQSGPGKFSFSSGGKVNA